ncbi:MAG: carbohydrate kinase family protein [Candidatus Sungbacteria bacterium]|nr:carbohydrate kinase family protein [Candidatus Sungbacteria bacterium]
MHDFIAIGDIVTDAFIKLQNPAAHIDIDHNVREVCMRFGDKVPYEDVVIVPAVGNSANAAVAAARLGLKSALVSNLGNDYFGKECMDALAVEKVDTRYMRVHPGRKTNYHYVLWYEDDRTILIKHEDYEYALPDIDDPKWIYLSSLGEQSLPFHHVIEEYLWKHPKVKFAFQPGTFQMKLGKDALAGLYRRTDVFFCNKEEAQRILKIEESDPKRLLEAMHALGPKIVVITDGTKGAYAYSPSTIRQAHGGEQSRTTSSGQNSLSEFWFMPPYPDPKPPYERTGAGDAFSSTFTIALALGLNVVEALLWAPINSMSVVQQVGARAGLLNRSQLAEYLTKAPKEYVPRQL